MYQQQSKVFFVYEIGLVVFDAHPPTPLPLPQTTCPTDKLAYSS
jgi:hypothetical protein